MPETMHLADKPVPESRKDSERAVSPSRDSQGYKCPMVSCGRESRTWSTPGIDLLLVILSQAQAPFIEKMTMFISSLSRGPGHWERSLEAHPGSSVTELQPSLMF